MAGTVSLPARQEAAGRRLFPAGEVVEGNHALFNGSAHASWSLNSMGDHHGNRSQRKSSRAVEHPLKQDAVEIDLLDLQGE